MSVEADRPFRVVRIDVHRLAAPLATPRRNAFGAMTERPGLLVSATLDCGTTGWGEIFANWPAFGAAHRARIVTDCLSPHATARGFETAAEFWQTLTDATEVLAIQCAEPGPFAQAIGGLEIAVQDALARRVGVPLWRYIGGASQSRVRAYASGVTAGTLDRLVPPLCDAGWTAFKLKVGFGADADRRALDRLRGHVGPNAAVMVDANQAWSRDDAIANLAWLADYDLTWLEEPISALASGDDWKAVCAASPIPIAAGENLRGAAAFKATEAAGVAVLQPDPIKWGGLTGWRSVANARSAGTHFAPHCLCGAVGSAATAALAVAEDAAFMEVDVTDNPLRSELWPLETHVHDGCIRIDADTPGHGVTPTEGYLERWHARDASSG